MQTVLAHPSRGYYPTRDPIGDDVEKSDFVTSPEIHQIFGELMGAWLLQEWVTAGSPQEIEYIEMGPGKGTLASDIFKTVDSLRVRISQYEYLEHNFKSRIK